MNVNPNATGGISGIVYSGQTPREPPQILVLGHEKSGKSSLATTLFDWPIPGARPLVLAVDSSGPESCGQLGYPVAHIKIKDQPGETYAEKMEHTLLQLRRVWKPLSSEFPFSSIVFDCQSTFSEMVLTEDQQNNPSKDPRRNYLNTLPILKRTFWDLKTLGVPVIHLAWERPAQTVMTGSKQSKREEYEPGGPEIAGKFRKILAGLCTQIMILRMKKIGVGQPGADQDGFSRVLMTRTDAGTLAGGRYQTDLPNPCAPHLGYVLSLMLKLPMPGQSQ